MKKGIFIINLDRFFSSGRNSSSDKDYDCTDCIKSNTHHQIISIPGPEADGKSGIAVRGEPTTIRKCTGCGKEDGPWVSA